MNASKDFYPQVFRDLLINEVKRRLFEEGIPRIRKCLSLLTHLEIWHEPNLHTNSVGVLVLHLCGNARQWIISGLGGAVDNRNRDREFAPEHKPSADELSDLLKDLQLELEQVLDDLPPEVLLEPFSIQGLEENGVSVLIHVTEHFSYHVGQITQSVKRLKNVDTGYYNGMNLGQTTVE
ncbi:MAG: DinB family protein [Saprospiraceae bacterium]